MQEDKEIATVEITGATTFRLHVEYEPGTERDVLVTLLTLLGEEHRDTIGVQFAKSILANNEDAFNELTEADTEEEN